MNFGLRRCTCLLLRQIYSSSKQRLLHNLIFGGSGRNLVQYQNFQQRLTQPSISLVISQRTATKKGKKITLILIVMKIFFCVETLKYLIDFILSKTFCLLMNGIL